MKKYLWLLILIPILLTILPFFHPGLFDVHDPTSAFRVYTLVSTLRLGQFPAYWSNLLNFGYGYPLHLYYAPLFGYLSALFVPLGVSHEVAVKAALAVASLVGASGIYILFHKSNRYAAIIASFAFILLPYRAGALYVRGSYSEFLAMSLIPWIIYYWGQPQSNKKTIAVTASVTACFILAHNTLPVVVAPIILLLMMLYQQSNWRGVVTTSLLTFGLSAWFVLPVIFERGFVQVESIARLTDFHDHFLTLSQLWYSPWGYGGSAVGVVEDGMSFMIGKGQVILALLGVAYLIKHKVWKQLGLLCFITFFAIFLSIPISKLLWEGVPFLSVIQFPWRSLAVIGVGISILSGYSIKLIPQKLQLFVTVILIFLLASTNVRYFRPQEYRDYSPEILSNQDNLDPLVRDKIPEYLPIWMPTILPRSGDGFLRTSTSTFGNFNFEVPQKLVVNTAYMPHWQMNIDGHSVPITYTDQGLVTSQAEIPAGKHILNLIWRRTPIEKVGQVTSIVAVIAVIGLLLL